MRVKIFFVALLVLILLSGCMITPKFFTLNPQEDYSSYWLNGKKYIGTEQENIKIVVAFDRVEHWKAIFYMQVLNQGTQTFDLIPENFTTISDVEFGDNGYEVSAINPEKMIMKLEKDIAVKETRLSNRKQVDIFFELCDLTGDLLQDRNERDQELDRIEDETRHVSNEISYISAEDDIRNLNEVKAIWDNKVLRRTTLRPGDVISGLVYFPLNEFAKSMQLNIPIGNTVFELQYSQVKNSFRK